MAPLENTGVAETRPIDSLMRALLCVAQQIGRPVSEADVRRLAALPDAGLDEAGFLSVGAQLGLEASALDLAAAPLDELPTPFAVVAASGVAHVVVSGRGEQWTMLDVIEGRVWQTTVQNVKVLGARALVLRLPAVPGQRIDWYAPLIAKVRPAILKLAGASFLINLLGLATPLFMMLVLNRVIGRGDAGAVITMMTALSAAVLAAYALDFALRVARGWLSARTGARLDIVMSGEVVHHLMQLPYRHFERTPSGVIAERLRQLDVLRAFFTGQMPALAIDLAFVVLFLAAAFAIPVMIGVSLATHRAQRQLTDDNFQALAAKASTLTETVANAQTIKALGLEAEVERRWQARVEQAAATNFRVSHLANIAASASGILQLVASLVLIVVGVHEIEAGYLTVGGLIAANMLAMRALMPMRQLVAAWHQLQAVRAAFRRIDELMHEPVESQPGTLAPLPPITGDRKSTRLNSSHIT